MLNPCPFHSYIFFDDFFPAYHTVIRSFRASTECNTISQSIRQMNNGGQEKRSKNIKKEKSARNFRLCYKQVINNL